MLRLLAAIIAVLAVSSAPVFAGIADTPLPARTKFLYSVPGVINTATGFGTFFECTNVDKASATVGVEVFGTAGGAPLNDFTATSVSVAPGATVMLGTRDASAGGFSLDQNLALETVTRGSARILASSTKVLCTVFVVDAAAFSGTSWSLNVIAKTKQKAAN